MTTDTDTTLTVALTGKVFLDIAPHGRFIATPEGYALAETTPRADLLAVVVQAYEDVGMPDEFDHAYWDQQRTLVLQVIAADLSLNSVAREREDAEHREDLAARIEDPIGYDAPRPATHRISRLPNPDTVGSAEYRAVYELVEAAEGDPVHILAILAEFNAWVSAIQMDVEGYLSTGPHG